MKYLSLLLLAATLASAQHCRKIDIDKSSGFCTVPDPALTPGKWTLHWRAYRTVIVHAM
jgi:hypothetical protein